MPLCTTIPQSPRKPRKFFNRGFHGFHGWEERNPFHLLGYLNITGLELALLLNFKEAKLAWKRVVSGNKGDD